MKQIKFLGLGLAAVVLTIGLVACGGNSKKDANTKDDPQHNVVMVIDTADIDGRSPNQSAWEGMQERGREHKLPEGPQGYAYIQPNEASDYTPNIGQAIPSQFKMIFDIGYLLENTVVDAVDTNPETNFVLIDDIINGKSNVASTIFKDSEFAYPAGVAAASTTKINKAGFIGGAEGLVTDRFQAGFERGVVDAGKKLGKDIQIASTYTGTLADAPKGRILASSMYQAGANVIYRAMTAARQGIFRGARTPSKTGSKNKVRVISIGRDQNEDDKYTIKGGKDDNLALVSTIKGVDIAVKKISDLTSEDKFPGGEHLTYGLKDGGVDLTTEALSDQTKTAAKGAKE